jgi:hypothetical protein
LYYIKTLNGAGKFIFRCCPRRKRLFAHASQGRPHSRCEQSEKKMNSQAGPQGSKQEVSGAQKGVLEKVEKGSASGRKLVRKR